jgi:hypothetical protein
MEHIMRPTRRSSVQNCGRDSRTSHTDRHTNRADRSNRQIHSLMNMRKKQSIARKTSSVLKLLTVNKNCACVGWCKRSCVDGWLVTARSAGLIEVEGDGANRFLKFNFCRCHRVWPGYCDCFFDGRRRRVNDDVLVWIPTHHGCRLISGWNEVPMLV